jgi:hypothetical protein
MALAVARVVPVAVRVLAAAARAPVATARPPMPAMVALAVTAGPPRSPVWQLAMVVRVVSVAIRPRVWPAMAAPVVTAAMASPVPLVPGSTERRPATAALAVLVDRRRPVPPVTADWAAMVA